MNDQLGKNQQRTTCIFELVETQISDGQKIKKLQYWENIKKNDLFLKIKSLTYSTFFHLFPSHVSSSYFSPEMAPEMKFWGGGGKYCQSADSD